MDSGFTPEAARVVSTLVASSMDLGGVTPACPKALTLYQTVDLLAAL